MSVAVAVSGGVDSLLTLLLLKDQGEDVRAVHARFLPDSPALESTISGLQNTCARLGVDFDVVDLKKEFQTLVVDPFMQAYLDGLTPNPCAHCNRRIKFGLLLETARKLGASTLATGHYARIESEIAHGPGLFRGIDRVKEQSYFLSLLTREQLATARFPLGGWTKEAVKAEVSRRGFPVPAGGESQEVCFIPRGDYRDFIEQRRDTLPEPGSIVLSSGERVGTHQGLWRYTLGQRRGLGVAHSEPLYVLAKRHTDNTLVVGTAGELLSNSCLVGDINLLVPYQEWPDQVLVQTIYRQEARPARIREYGEMLQVTFSSPRKRAAPGQIAGFYSIEGRVLAGGIVHG